MYHHVTVNSILVIKRKTRLKCVISLLVMPTKNVKFQIIGNQTIQILTTNHISIFFEAATCKFVLSKDAACHKDEVNSPENYNIFRQTEHPGIFYRNIGDEQMVLACAGIE
jgi:hypothetical protein